MRKLFVAMLTLVMGLAVWAAPAWADDVIKANYNGTAIVFDQSPVIEEGRTLVPARAIFETLGLTVDYDPAVQVVKAYNDTYTIEMTIDGTTATVNGETKTLDVPAKILNDRTMVPIRFISESMGLEVAWDEATRTIEITSNVPEVPEVPAFVPDDFTGEYYKYFPTTLNFIKYADLQADGYTVVTNEEATLSYNFAINTEDTQLADTLQAYYNALTEAGWVAEENVQSFVKDNVQLSFTAADENTMTVLVKNIVSEQQTAGDQAVDTEKTQPEQDETAAAGGEETAGTEGEEAGN